MSASTEICNEALMELGNEEITDIDNRDRVSRLCKRVYEPSVDVLLKLLKPNFATFRTTLAKAGAAEFFYAFKYRKPTDPFCLQVINLGEDNLTDPYRVENDFIYCNIDDTINLVYIGRVLETAKFDVLFRQALVARVRYLLSFPIAKTRPIMEANFALYEQARDEATAVDSQEGQPEELVQRDILDAAEYEGLP